MPAVTTPVVAQSIHLVHQTMYDSGHTMASLQVGQTVQQIGVSHLAAQRELTFKREKDGHPLVAVRGGAPAGLLPGPAAEQRTALLLAIVALDNQGCLPSRQSQQTRPPHWVLWQAASLQHEASCAKVQCLHGVIGPRGTR